MKHISLLNRVLIPIVSILLLVELLIGVSSYRIQKNQLKNLMEQEVNGKVEKVKNRLIDNQEAFRVFKSSLKINYLRLVKSVRFILSSNPTMYSPANLNKVAKGIGVDEIHVADGKGILVSGNVSAFFGYDYAKQDQSRPFLSMGDEGLSQDPQLRGVDKKPFMYTGINLKDKPGFVQIGLEPMYYQEISDRFSASGTLKGEVLGKEGFILIFHGKQLIASTNNAGKTLDDYPYLQEYLDKDIQSYLSYQKKDMFLSAHKANEYWLVGVVYTSDYLSPLFAYLNFILLVSVVSLLVAFYSIRYILNTIIIRPLDEVKESINRIASGDLKSYAIDIERKDVIGNLNKGFSFMLESLRTIVSSVNQSTKSVIESSQKLESDTNKNQQISNQIYSVIEEFRTSSEVQKEKTVSSVKMIQDITKDIHKIVGVSESFYLLSGQTIQNAEKGKLLLDKMEAQMLSIKNSVSDFSDKMSFLSSKSLEIGKVLKVITDLASKTNLLALNASIEAANAGDKGLGFAVVADQVNKLAESSRYSTYQVSQLIKDVQNSISETKNTIDLESKNILESIQFIKEANTFFHNIIGSIKNIASQTNEIITNTKAISTESQSIQGSSQDILQSLEASERSAHSVSELFQKQIELMASSLNSTKNLSNMSFNLQVSVEKFSL